METENIETQELIVPCISTIIDCSVYFDHEEIPLCKCLTCTRAREILLLNIRQSKSNSKNSKDNIANKDNKNNDKKLPATSTQRNIISSGNNKKMVPYRPNANNTYSNRKNKTVSKQSAQQSSRQSIQQSKWQSAWKKSNQSAVKSSSSTSTWMSNKAALISSSSTETKARLKPLGIKHQSISEEDIKNSIDLSGLDDWDDSSTEKSDIFSAVDIVALTNDLREYIKKLKEIYNLR